MKALLTLGFVAMALAGCVSSQAIVLPDGTAGEIIQCNRYAADCVAEAGQICPRGYDFLGSDSESRPFLLATNAGLVGGTAQDWTMTVRCH